MMAYGFQPLSMPNRWQECAGMSGLRLNSSRQSDGQETFPMMTGRIVEG